MYVELIDDGRWICCLICDDGGSWIRQEELIHDTSTHTQWLVHAAAALTAALCSVGPVHFVVLIDPISPPCWK